MIYEERQRELGFLRLGESWNWGEGVRVMQLLPSAAATECECGQTVEPDSAQSYTTKGQEARDTNYSKKKICYKDIFVWLLAWFCTFIFFFLQ